MKLALKALAILRSQLSLKSISLLPKHQLLCLNKGGKRTLGVFSDFVFVHYFQYNKTTYIETKRKKSVKISSQQMK
jgi:hypothetical protein